MPIDNDLLMRDGSSDLTATEGTPTAVDFSGEDLFPLTYRIDVPAAGGSSPTADFVIQGSANNSDFVDLFKFPQIIAAGQYHFEGITKYRYRRAKVTVGGSNPNFGAVKVSVHGAGRYDEK